LRGRSALGVAVVATLGLGILAHQKSLGARPESGYRQHAELGPPAAPSGWQPAAATAATPGAAATRQSGVTFVVDREAAGGCSDEAPGTASRPWCTIARSSAALQGGDTVLVRAGVYRESIAVVSGTKADPVTYQGELGTILDGTGMGAGVHAFSVASAHHVRIRGFEVRNFRGRRGHGIDISGNSSDVEVSDVHAHDNDNGIVMRGTSSLIVLRRVRVGRSRYGVGFEDSVRGITIAGALAYDNVDANSSPATTVYVNGDGFSADRGTSDLVITDAVAIGNGDAGFDITGAGFTCTRCVAGDNAKYGFRLWQHGPSVLVDSLAYGNGWFPIQMDGEGARSIERSTILGRPGDRGNAFEVRGPSVPLTIRDSVISGFANAVFSRPFSGLDEDRNVFVSPTGALGFTPGSRSHWLLDRRP